LTGIAYLGSAIGQSVTAHDGLRLGSATEKWTMRDGREDDNMILFLVDILNVDRESVLVVLERMSSPVIGGRSAQRGCCEIDRASGRGDLEGEPLAKFLG
jgi:hypothetical protein